MGSSKDKKDLKQKSAGKRPNTERMKSGVRSDTAHRTLEQGQAQYASKKAKAGGKSSGYENKENRKKYRSGLSRLRKEMGAEYGNGKEVSHDVADSKGGAATLANVSLKTRTANRVQGTKSNNA
jgi:hypothetical protein